MLRLQNYLGRTTFFQGMHRQAVHKPGAAQGIPGNFSGLQKRLIVHHANLTGMYASLSDRAKHFSPLLGAAFCFTQRIDDLYDRAQCEDKQKQTATSQLVKLLFHKQGEEFRTTKNQSHPAYYLTPKLLAHLVHHLNNDTLRRVDVRNKISNLLRKSQSDRKISLAKTNLLLDLIIESKKECIGKRYPLYLTETILLSFLHLKVMSREELLEFIKKLHALDGIVAEPGLLYKENDYLYGYYKDLFSLKDSTRRIYANAKFTIKSDYEKIVLMLMSLNCYLQKVKQSRYGYQNKSPKSNCFEVSFHNLCNAILFNGSTGQFSFQQLPENLKPNDEFIEFYRKQNFQVYDMHTREIGQAFMDLVSGVENLEYGFGNYELAGTCENFLLLMNYLFGSTATSFANLSLQFSNKDREINFTLNEKGDVITIKIIQKSVICHELFFRFNYVHAELKSDSFF